jgi:hypothetical protein
MAVTTSPKTLFLIGSRAGRAVARVAMRLQCAVFKSV